MTAAGLCSNEGVRLPPAPADDKSQRPPLWVAPLLRACEAETSRELADETPAALATRLREWLFRELTPERIEREGWIESGPEPDLSETPADLDPGLGPSHTRAKARQLAGFTVFFDSLEESDRTPGAWQVRVYHDETGDEVSLDGAQPGPWVTWILDKALAVRGPALHQLVVTIEGARELAPSADDEQTRAVEVTLRVDGLPELERALGRATVEAVLGRGPASWARQG